MFRRRKLAEEYARYRLAIDWMSNNVTVFRLSTKSAEPQPVLVS
jgi:hypothetical protein